MGVPPPLGRNQQKFYYVQGLPNWDPSDPAAKDKICQYEKEYEAYRLAREHLAETMKGEYFRVEFINNDFEEPPICFTPPKVKVKPKSRARKRTAKRRSRTR